jgi:hypothetical protein
VLDAAPGGARVQGGPQHAARGAAAQGQQRGAGAAPGAQLAARPAGWWWWWWLWWWWCSPLPSTPPAARAVSPLPPPPPPKAQPTTLPPPPTPGVPHLGVLRAVAGGGARRGRQRRQRRRKVGLWALWVDHSGSSCGKDEDQTLHRPTPNPAPRPARLPPPPSTTQAISRQLATSIGHAGAGGEPTGRGSRSSAGGADAGASGRGSQAGAGGRGVPALSGRSLLVMAVGLRGGAGCPRLLPLLLLSAGAVCRLVLVAQRTHNPLRP